MGNSTSSPESARATPAHTATAAENAFSYLKDRQAAIANEEISGQGVGLDMLSASGTEQEKKRLKSALKLISKKMGHTTQVPDEILNEKVTAIQNANSVDKFNNALGIGNKSTANDQALLNYIYETIMSHELGSENKRKTKSNVN